MAKKSKPEDDLTVAYLAGFHKRDDEVRLLKEQKDIFRCAHCGECSTTKPPYIPKGKMNAKEK